MLIGGELVPSLGGEWITSLNPANEETLGSFPAGNAEDMSRAVDAASRVQPQWQGAGTAERAARLREAADQLEGRADELLQLEVRDTGNTVTKMARDVEMAVDYLRYFAGLGLEIKGETIPATPENLHFTLREPYGVVGRIIPFNHPVMFAASRIAAPLIAGNAVVVKPPETSSLSATRFAEICRDVFPPGVVNIVTGTGVRAGDALVRHPEVRRIAFIGSVETGLAVQRAAAETGVKHVSLELGGKNPMVVFADADPVEVAANAVAGMNFAWQGQSCGSTSRLLLHESLYEEVLAGVLERVAAIRLGEPTDPSSQMGPMNSLPQLEKVERYVAIGREEGARLAHGGGRPAGSDFQRGYWHEPTVFADVDMTMRIAREEIFGPVMSVLRFRDTEEAIAMANATDYGLTASIWTHDLRRALRTAKALRCGYVWINGVSAHYLGTPFGGVKNSGTGREEGIDELLSYTEAKAIHVHLGGA
jgi:acyl-CoA reductase-like NAD-dependent aldehyde dehydrogenase